MNTNDLNESTNRRNFLGTLATGAAAVGLTSFAPGLSAFATGSGFDTKVYGDPEDFFDKINGKHRVVFDSPRPHDIYPFAWPRVFLISNVAMKSAEKECSVVVVLRHASICYAFEDKMWSKYNFGKVFEAPDPATKEPSVRNPFWKPKDGAYVIPGVGEVKIGIDQLQKSGVMFCVCDAAMTVYSSAIGQQTGQSGEEIKKDWLTALLPGIQPVPSGVWALGRAQEKKCAYIFAG
ncbi:MAG TPA: twin-arginine translocation signal domain-containing protein [Chitinophagaceae bacterium]|nr:twin-arginine translocation signal domain-containing protein [Chitinophagaceae bacterium]MCB9054533.1 twin-arginine translocation signal domain-containing protein [Chitinophagales bacterium]HPG10268.1 twin-arginine translocation signal domain-containing protein [Chitinophagaceae bacterium]HRX94372.1 twin-arginine translocation signal domain-containing protein [Chitinophagaceae bacterium]